MKRIISLAVLAALGSRRNAPASCIRQHFVRSKVHCRFKSRNRIQNIRRHTRRGGFSQEGEGGVPCYLNNAHKSPLWRCDELPLATFFFSFHLMVSVCVLPML